MSRTIMIVDDETMITNTLSNLVKLFLKHNVVTFNSPSDALQSEKLSEGQVDLVISDFMMPGMNGLEFLKRAKEKSPELVTVMLTGYADKENAIRSINEVGLYYYIEKPWDNNALLKIVQNGLERKEMQETLVKNYDEIKKSHNEIERLYDLLKNDYNTELENSRSLIVTLANVIEAKDSYTDGHTRRVASICRMIGERLGYSKERLSNLEIAGIIHDIGKVGVSEAIINKPGKLTDEEFTVMKNHTVILS
ncbi:MAG: response regulator, partial [Clostridia bacterium]|nr:response regulator [Clostridia bacterium]